MAGRSGGAAYYTRFAQWLAAEGVPLDPDTFTGRPPRSLVLVSRAMQPHADRVDERRYTFVGPCLDERGHQESWAAPSRPLVLVSLGSAYTDAPEFYRAANTRLHRWVPQLAVLGHASAFVTHAGMGGSSEGLWQGVPMVAVPQAVDQFGNAARLAERAWRTTCPPTRSPRPRCGRLFSRSTTPRCGP